MRIVHRPIAIGIVLALKEIFESGYAADKVIERQFKNNKKWGSRDRRLFAETVYDVVRWWRLLLWNVQFDWPESDRSPTLSDKQIEAVLSVYGESRNIKFPFPEVHSQMGRVDVPALKHSVPNWLEHWASQQVDDWPTVAGVLNEQAPVFLRANRLKTTPQSLVDALAAADIKATHIERDALMLLERANVFKTREFKEGYFEVQDLNSQKVSEILDPKPGERVIDACAGAGGKTLHIASLMQNKGRVLALDVSERKLSELKLRARRAGLSCVEARWIESTKVIKRLENSCERLLLDVPCSGLGVLRRNPDMKWKMNPERINQLSLIQADILLRYSSLLKVGGVLVYSTCSIARSENMVQIENFLQHQKGFRLEHQETLPPTTNGGDGFFIARLARIS